MKHIILFIISTQLLGCNQAKRDHMQLLLGYQQTLKHLEIKLDSLQQQEEISESYLATAHLHQVSDPQRKSSYKI